MHNIVGENIFRSDEGLKRLGDETGILFTEALFTRMRDYGRGPHYVGAPEDKYAFLAQWAAYCFRIPPDAPKPADSYAPLPAAKSGADGRPRRLLASEPDGEGVQLRSMLEECGAEVVQVSCELRAAQAVSRERLDGVVLRFNSRIDAEFVVADVCMRRGVPFVVVTEGAERPASMGRGGVLVHNPRSINEVLAALESLPPDGRPGLNLPFPPLPASSDNADSTEPNAA